MSNLSWQSRNISRKSLIYNRKLWQRFRELKIPLSGKTDTLPTDLGDIREVCCQYLNAFDRFFSMEVQKDKRLMVELFESIRNDLYIHLDYHLKELRKPLELLIKKLKRSRRC